MKIIGITGGIGSGKSTVCRIFESLGIPVFNSDLHAKQVYEEFPETTEALKARYGSQILTDGKVDRGVLAAKVFGSKEELEALNNLVHPFVRKQFEKWVIRQNSTYVIREAAILFESGSFRDCDEVILVTAPETLRITRVKERDRIGEEKIVSRINNQWTDDQKRALSQHEIVNDGVAALLPQALAIHEKIIRG